MYFFCLNKLVRDFKYLNLEEWEKWFNVIIFFKFVMFWNIVVFLSLGMVFNRIFVVI